MILNEQPNETKTSEMKCEGNKNPVVHLRLKFINKSTQKKAKRRCAKCYG